MKFVYMEKLRKYINQFLLAVVLIAYPSLAYGEISWGRVLSGAYKAYSAYSISDKEVQDYVHEYVTYLDKQNKIASSSSSYGKRLANLTKGLTSVDGIPLNFKVYITNEINAFACADGSVRVYSGLMDKMTDDEVLGVIGHEIGHVAHKDTKNAFKKALLNSALIDGLASTSNWIRRLSDSQLGALGEAMMNAKYSRKQESNADDYGYDFLKKHGKNPWVLAMAFSKLDSMSSSGISSKFLQMFSSHPTTKSRIDHIIQKCKKDKIAAPAGCKLK